MPFSNRLRFTLLCTTTAVLVAVPAFLFWRNEEIYAKHLYWLQIATEAGLIVCLLCFALRAARRTAGRTAGMLLSLSSCLGLLLFADVWVVGWRYDTSGPGGRYCATHVFWERRFVQNNREGFWERELMPWTAPGPKTSCVIAAVGDSFTWGQGVLGRENRFTDLLEKSLRQAGDPGISVINFGLGGLNTVSETDIIRNKVGAVHPDVVMIFYLLNDIPAKEIIPIPAEFYNNHRIPQLLRFSPALNLLYWRALAPASYARFGDAYVRNEIAAYLDDASFGEHARELDRAAAEVRRLGARPVFVLLPATFFWTPATRAHRPAILAKLANTMRQTGAAVIELQDIEEQMKPGDFVLSSMDAHPSHAAHAMIAGRLVDWFTQHPTFTRPLRDHASQ